MPTTFDALASDTSSSSSRSESDSEQDVANDKKGDKAQQGTAACYEDLTIQREDEEIVLAAVYGEDYVKKDGVWGCPVHCVHVRPPDVEKERIGSELIMKVQLVKKYPYVAPSIEFEDVKGLSLPEQKELLKDLKKKCRLLAKSGLVMVCELVQAVEDFLFTHNKDPTNANLSAWDQMHAREEEKKKIAQEEVEKLDFMCEDISPSRLKDDSQHMSKGFDEFEREKIEREYSRQKKALIAAKQKRQRQLSQDFDGDASNESNSYDDESDFDDESYQDNDPNSSSSRYQNDFIQLEKLGRGGGGEVVKVRNRLDKRIYAVKKVILQSENGKMEKVGKLENAKLKREVMTISRMTHKNIVRYYQAWVEGGTKVHEDRSVETNRISKQNESKSVKDDDADDVEKSSNHSKDDSDSSQSRKGFWMSSFNDMNDSIDSSSWSDDSTIAAHNASQQDDFDFMQSPLMVGFGVENSNQKSNLVTGYQIIPPSSSKSNIFDESDSELLDSSNVKDNVGVGRSTLYIQMEYCSNTLRHLIDDGSLQKMDKDNVWKLVIQIVEALEYIHKRKVIHRDLKPGNVFLDSENNVRLGDFGLATTGKSDSKRQTRVGDKTIDAIDDISHLLGGSIQASTSNMSLTINNDSAITGGVGTRFYCAPEQEGRQVNHQHGRTNYDTKADIFSLGIVLFEIFHPPFVTLMERAETLEQLRSCSSKYPNVLDSLPKQNIFQSNLWKDHAEMRLPKDFDCPKNLQKLIIWCLQFSPEHRPSAEDILKSDLIPHLDSSNEILKEMFNRQTTTISNEIDITWDTDTAAKLREFFPLGGKKSVMSCLLRDLKEIIGTSWKDSIGLQLSSMNCVAMRAANIALKRAVNAGRNRGVCQQTAAIIAMSAATTSASTGNVDGSMPRLTNSICARLKKIFELHGAMQLRPPLLRPKVHLDVEREGIVEVMNERGVILLLPEDLTSHFARAIGRAGGLGVKRYDIDKTYHSSKIGGHPRETLEASFDIILEGANSRSDIFEAEVIMMICQVIRQSFHPMPSELSSQRVTKTTPFWFLRVTHTRLADAILDVCEVPQRESTRRVCLNILTICSAPPPSTVLKEGLYAPSKSNIKENYQNSIQQLDELLNKAVRDQGLSQKASDNLKAFLTFGCLPFPTDITLALKRLHDASIKVRSLNEKNKKNKRYLDIARGIRSLQNLADTLKRLRLYPTANDSSLASTGFLPPSYISLDLGLRQQERSYHGQLYFQALILPDNCGEHPDSFVRNDILLSTSPKLSLKIAEGGRYEDLVRKFRPPGNFASIQVDKYTSAPIPMCIGARIFVRRLVERAYLEASWRARLERIDSEEDLLRWTLGQPDDVYACVQCVIVSMNGFDIETLAKRAMIAAILWAEGISAEYVLQSGVMMSLLKHSNATETSNSDWTIDEIEGICKILQIPFLVIVQDHLLKEKESVRLRWVEDSDRAEEFVPVNSLASEMRESLNKCKDSGTGDKASHTSRHPSKQFSGNQDSDGLKNSTFDVDLVFVDSDQFYLGLDTCSGRDQKSKSVKKKMKTSLQRVKSHFGNIFTSTYTHFEGCSILSVDVPFMVIRDFNSTAMCSNELTVIAAVTDILQNKHAKYRKTLKTLATCIDHMLRQKVGSLAETSGKVKSNSTKTQSITLSAFIYSFQDDKMDLLTLTI